MLFDNNFFFFFFSYTWITKIIDNNYKLDVIKVTATRLIFNDSEIGYKTVNKMIR